MASQTLKNWDIRSYAACKQALGKRKSLRLANNTSMETNGTSYTIYYHRQGVVEWYKSGVIVDSCGYRTVTTKERINAFLPAGNHVVSCFGNWYMQSYLPKHTRQQGPDIRYYNFEDGMYLADGSREWVTIDNAGEEIPISFVKEVKRPRKIKESPVRQSFPTLSKQALKYQKEHK